MIVTESGLSFGIDQTLGERMGWLKKNPVGNIIMGPNALATLREENDTWKRERDRFFGSDALFTTTETRQNRMYTLSSAYNWRFVNLDQAFRNVMGEPTRTLHVYSNVDGSTIVGDKKTDLLREVAYQRTGRGTVYYEPVHKQYHAVRQRTIEIVEINIAETSGELVQFLDDGRAQTYVTLHFRYKKKRV